MVVDFEVDFRGGLSSNSGICGLNHLLRQRIPYWGRVTLGVNLTETSQLELHARHHIGHVLGIGTLWSVRNQTRNPSTPDKVRDTHVISPLAQGAFDAAGGTSYTGPKVPLQQHGDGGRNTHWRNEVFGYELMSWVLWSHPPPISAVTLQALADLGYAVDLNLADPYTLPSADAAAAAIGTAAPPPFELGREVPPSVVVCRRRDPPVEEPEGLLSESRRGGLGSEALRVGSMDAIATPGADCEVLTWH